MGDVIQLNGKRPKEPELSISVCTECDCTSFIIWSDGILECSNPDCGEMYDELLDE